MSSIGPSLPPHLAKRKRTPDDNADEVSPSPKQARNTDEIDLEEDDSDDDYGPTAPSSHTVAAKPTAGPTMPPSASSQKNQDEIDLDDSDDDDNYGPSAPAPKPPIGPSAPPKRTIGPALPPPGTAATAADSSSDSEDDDYGPALPSANAGNAPQTSIFDRPSSNPTVHEPAPSKRDDWMLAPPTSSGYTERDPTKIKNRRFASSKPHSSAPSGPSEISSIWTETPEQKRKRLEDAVLGRAAPAGSDLEAAQNQARKKSSRAEDERHRRTAENVAASRGKSLYEQHQEARNQGRRDGKDVEEEDDPSKRAFDREKDMAIGGALSAAQKKELLNKTKDLSGRFQKGSYL